MISNPPAWRGNGNIDSARPQSRPTCEEKEMTENMIIWAALTGCAALFVPAMWAGDKLAGLFVRFRDWCRNAPEEEDFSGY